jgi:crotonobetainyl-CoA:carnitine CoA-transferase CaiB-like acyl-CoA transferase
VTTEAATYEWLVAQATVQRQTGRHAAVEPTPPRLLPAADGRFVIAALPRHAAEFGALKQWVVELGLEAHVEELFFLDLAVERGGVPVATVATDPEAAAMYHAGADALRCVAEHLPAEEFFVGAQRRGLAAGVVWAPEEVLANDHFQARGFPVSVRHEDLGCSFVYPGAPFHATASPWVVRGRAPHVGEHQATVLGEAVSRGQR